MLKNHNAVTLVRLEPAALRSRVKHSTTEPVRSLVAFVLITTSQSIDAEAELNIHKYVLIYKFEPLTWDFQQCGMSDQQSLRSACAYAQSDQSLG